MRLRIYTNQNSTLTATCLVFRFCQMYIPPMPYPALLGSQKCTVLIGRNRVASSIQIECGILVLSVQIQYGEPSTFLHTVIRYGLFTCVVLEFIHERKCASAAM